MGARAESFTAGKQEVQKEETPCVVACARPYRAFNPRTLRSKIAHDRSQSRRRETHNQYTQTETSTEMTTQDALNLRGTLQVLKQGEAVDGKTF